MIRNASDMYPISNAAKSFQYYGFKNGKNILPNVYFCFLCGDVLENKPGLGTNIFIRHLKHICSDSFVSMNKTQFGQLLSKLFNLVGQNINKDKIVEALATLDLLNGHNM